MQGITREGRPSWRRPYGGDLKQYLKILLSRGADQYLRDDNNRTALDLTQPTRRNRKERHTRAGGCWGDPTIEPIYKEDVVSRDADRREIARILGGTNEEPARVERSQQVLDPARHIISQSHTSDQFKSIPYLSTIKQWPSYNEAPISLSSHP